MPCAEVRVEPRIADEALEPLYNGIARRRLAVCDVFHHARVAVEPIDVVEIILDERAHFEAQRLEPRGWPVFRGHTLCFVSLAEANVSEPPALSSNRVPGPALLKSLPVGVTACLVIDAFDALRAARRRHSLKACRFRRLWRSAARPRRNICGTGMKSALPAVLPLAGKEIL